MYSVAYKLAKEADVNGTDAAIAKNKKFAPMAICNYATFLYQHHGKIKKRLGLHTAAIEGARAAKTNAPSAATTPFSRDLFTVAENFDVDSADSWAQLDQIQHEAENGIYTAQSLFEEGLRK